MKRITRSKIGLSFALWLAAAGASGVHGMPAPVLKPVPPVSLRRGQTLDLQLPGDALGAIASTSVSGPAGLDVNLVKAEKADDKTVRLKIAASADAATGDRLVRLIGPNGVTRPLDVFVSQFPVVSETEPNDSSAAPRPVQLPATIMGRISKAGDVERFGFHATKDQTLIFDLHAARIGSPLLPVVTLHNSSGREMRTTIEHRGGDPVVIFRVPEDDAYTLRIRDLEYRGGETFGYRVAAGRIPYLEALIPSSGRPGERIAAKAIGYNLADNQTVSVDLTRAAPGRIEVRAGVEGVWSNALPFEVTELPQAVESEPNDSPAEANAVELPMEVSGHIGRGGDVDFYKVHVPYKQTLSFEVVAGRYGSPMTPLLQLRNAQGNVIESNDGTPDADARIIRELDTGDYVISVRDLTFAGGPGCWYRLKAERAATVPQDFAVRFIPDAPRLHRGGNVALWCEVKRFNGFHGEVKIEPESLPAGVSASPVVLGEKASGWFTLSASADAALGTAPIGFRATASLGPVPVAHRAEPEIEGRPVPDAYLTVLEPAPFGVEAIADLKPARIEQMEAEIRTLSAKLVAADPGFAARMSAWEKKVAGRPVWAVLKPDTFSSAKGATLELQSDGSLRVSGNPPPQDTFTVVAQTSLKGITAVRLEALADDHLPGHGPGAAPNGNFVLTNFELSAGPADGDARPVALRNASADFAQADFPVAAAVDDIATTGWAIDPQTGRNHSAVFETATPVGSDGPTTLTFVLAHESPFAGHLLGRFRLSVTTADPKSIRTAVELPPGILTILATPAERRTDAQKDELAEYFRTTDPESSAARNRLEALRRFVAPYAEIARLEKDLKDAGPMVAKEQARWAKAMAAGMGWSVLELTGAESENGARLRTEPDGAVFVDGANPPTDTYHLKATSRLQGITAIRLEALADPRLPANGPGRSDDGNFVLSHFRVDEKSKDDSDPREVELKSAKASFEQEKFPASAALHGKADTGWAIFPAVGRPSEITFYPAKPIPPGELNFTLEQRYNTSHHTLGHFRVWVTSNPQPDAALRPPVRIARLLSRGGKNGSPDDKKRLSAYYSSVAPELAPIRQRLADLREQVPPLPLKFAADQSGMIPVPVSRADGFSGEIRVTLEGFATGRQGDKPAPITRDFKIDPLTLSDDRMFGMLTLEPQRREETGTRMVVLKAEAKVGNETVTEYSPAFPLTIEK